MAAKTRDQLRQAILSGDTKPQSKTITFFGQEIEVRQPDLQTILNFRNSSTEDRTAAMIDMIIAYAYVPETDEKIFESADRDQLLALPFGADFMELNRTISSLTNIQLMSDAETKNSAGTASSSS